LGHGIAWDDVDRYPIMIEIHPVISYNIFVDCLKNILFGLT
jgi:hypothetical protein